MWLSHECGIVFVFPAATDYRCCESPGANCLPENFTGNHDHGNHDSDSGSDSDSTGPNYITVCCAVAAVRLQGLQVSVGRGKTMPKKPKAQREFGPGRPYILAAAFTLILALFWGGQEGETARPANKNSVEMSTSNTDTTKQQSQVQGRHKEGIKPMNLTQMEEFYPEPRARLLALLQLSSLPAGQIQTPKTSEVIGNVSVILEQGGLKLGINDTRLRYDIAGFVRHYLYERDQQQSYSRRHTPDPEFHRFAHALILAGGSLLQPRITFETAEKELLPTRDMTKVLDPHYLEAFVKSSVYQMHNAGLAHEAVLFKELPLLQLVRDLKQWPQSSDPIRLPLEGIELWTTSPLHLAVSSREEVSPNANPNTNPNAVPNPVPDPVPNPNTKDQLRLPT